MGVYVLKRIGSSFLLLFGLLTIIFIIAHTAPGDPVTAVVSPTMPASAAASLRHEFGLDQSLLTQYTDWIRNAVSGNFGISFRHQRPVTEVIGSFFPNTVILGATAIFLELVFGILLGFAAARNHGSFIDKILTSLNLVVYTIPSFWIGMMLLLLFSYATGLLPSTQMHSIDAESLSGFDYWIDFFKHLILPALTIAIPGAAGIAKYFRASLLKTEQEDHILFAKSLGTSRKRLFLYHFLPNALTPLITIFGLEFGTLLAGTVVTETIFAWPGMGRLIVQAIFSRDYPLVMGCAIVAGCTVVAGNLLADILYSSLDPRVRITR